MVDIIKLLFYESLEYEISFYIIFDQTYYMSIKCT